MKSVCSFLVPFLFSLPFDIMYHRNNLLILDINLHSNDLYSADDEQIVHMLRLFELYISGVWSVYENFSTMK